MSRYRILPYRQGSRSAKALAASLDGLVLKLEGSRFRWKHTDIVINWGNIDPPMAYGLISMNRYISEVSNKLNFFRLIEGEEYCPPFWTNSEEIPNEEFPVVCRTLLAGHSGEGIVIANNYDELVPAPLYVKYLKKKEEFRVHIGRDRDGQSDIIATQRKARRQGLDNEVINYQIRNHGNGFIYQREGFEIPECVLDAAVHAFEETTLDFGAVDVIYNERKGRAWVLEINTAPGLEGATVNDYANFFSTFGEDN